MATFNLGDDYALGENSSGDLVVEHTPSGATLRYDSAAGAWTLDAAPLVTDELGVPAGRLWGTAENDLVEVFGGHGLFSGAQSTSSTSFSNTGFGAGAYPLTEAPPGATAVGQFIARIDIDDGAETFTVRPKIRDSSDTATSLSELAISTSATSPTVVASGWQELTSISIDDIYALNNYEGKVTASTATGNVRGGSNGVLMGWRL